MHTVSAHKAQDNNNDCESKQYTFRMMIKKMLNLILFYYQCSGNGDRLLRMEVYTVAQRLRLILAFIMQVSQKLFYIVTNRMTVVSFAN